MVVLGLLAATPAWADAPAPSFGSRAHFTEQGGAAVYQAACAGCHMADGRGAQGAGAYPALAANPALAAAAYPIQRVIHGSRAMPPFGRLLDDGQVAAVVDYIRTHFGNDYPVAPSASDSAAAR